MAGPPVAPTPGRIRNIGKLIVKAADATLTAAEMGGQQIGNTGQTGNVTLTLPTPAEGLRALIALGSTAAFYYRLAPGASKRIFLDGVDPAADNKYVQVANAAPGNMLWIEAFPTAAGDFDWYAVTLSGPWAPEA